MIKTETMSTQEPLPNPETAPGDLPASLQPQIDELSGKVREYEELIKRQQAEFDNYRKRTLRERDEYHRYSGFDILKDLLDVLDNFDRAVNVKLDGQADASPKALLDGMQMIRGQLEGILKKNHVSEVAGPGAPFSPDIHLAIAQEESPDVTEDTVAEVYQRGFSFHEKVLRVATVRVKKPAAVATAPAESSSAPGEADK